VTKRRRGPVVPRAALGFVSPGDVKTGFAFSVVRAMCHEIGTTGLGFQLLDQRAASGQLVEARNELVAQFLDETPCDWFWSVDSDMGFDADCLSRLIASADKTSRPFVGALCFGLRKNGEDYDLRTYDLRCFPTLYAWQETDEEVGFQVIRDYPRGQLVEVSGTGAACFVAHRSLLERIRAKFGPVWFDKLTHPKGDRTFSEDLSFCVRVAAVDTPVYVDTAVPTSHDKGGVFLTEAVWDEQEFLRINYLEPATEGV